MQGKTCSTEKLPQLPKRRVDIQPIVDAFDLNSVTHALDESTDAFSMSILHKALPSDVEGVLPASRKRKPSEIDDDYNRSDGKRSKM